MNVLKQTLRVKVASVRRGWSKVRVRYVWMMSYVFAKVTC